ncbi:FAD-dependent oxidoreductase [Phascolarctobacterium faecium]|uniref:FAD-dependent oxidoreductase n=1 Tax=Phascolarctobacterium faecium TaxID=33025 RepID=UPI0021098E77|nr:FAD-dependent oxidoreductase [Phascolarctobacterium faecium]MCQ5184910.1 FAD-dependent oxidoreductase [Phascolarctobacterium faecium]
MERMYDVIIIGGGPAGLAAAVYMARAQYKTLVIEKEKIGGLITITSEVVNYPGVLKTTGKELTEQMRQQAEGFGAEFLLAEALESKLDCDIKEVRNDKGTFKSLGVIMAMGAVPRQVGFTGESEYRGRGVAYCATCDGEFFTGLDVFVVGGGFAAAEEAIFLTRYARHVTVLVRGDDFTCAGSIADEVKRHEQITVLYNTAMLEVGGGDVLRYAVYENCRTGERTRYETGDATFGVFVFAGYVPVGGPLLNGLETDCEGYLVTDMDQKTNLDGVYGAGDLCIKNLRQVVTAVSDGAKAATSLERYAAQLHDKLKLPRFAVTKKQIEEPDVKHTEAAAADDGAFISEAIKTQLTPVFAKFTDDLLLRAALDNSRAAAEIRGFLNELTPLSAHLRWEETGEAVDGLPYIEVCRADGTSLGFRFHGVPGGHEFNSFIVTLYNAAGPGQAIGEEQLAAVKALRGNKKLQVVISLSCTMCPELVMAAGRLAVENDGIETDVFDINLFPELREQYKIMSVPCLIYNDKVSFGKKNIDELLQLIG